VDLDSQHYAQIGELSIVPTDFGGDAGIDVAELYREHFDYVWRILARFGVSIADLEDAAHEVFIVAHRRREEFDYRASPKSWLFGIARRVAARDLRTRTRRSRRHDAYRQVCAIVPPADQAEINDARILLERFLETLDPISLEIFVLAEFEKMTRPEIGDALDMKVNTVSSRLRRSRLAFKAMMEESGEHGADSVQAEGERSPPGGEKAKRRLAGALMPVFGGPGLAKKAAASMSGSAVAGAGTMSAGISSQVIAFAATVVLGTAGLWGVRTAMAEPAPTDGIAAMAEGTAAAPSREESTPRESPEQATAPREAEAAPAEAVAADAGKTESSLVGGEDVVVALATPRRSASPVVPVAGAMAAAPGEAGPASSSPRGVEAEMRLLREAKLALQQGRPNEALAKSESHVRKHSGGALEQEMAAVQVQALCALGRASDARAKGHDFARRFPGSPLAGTLDAGCPG
jgi:RNA polymerase sigma-70 factor (ECF subfamily)